MNNTITITEAIFIVSTVMNLLSFILVFLMYTHILSIKNTVNQLKEGMGTIISRMLGMEHVLAKLGNSFTEFMNTAGDMLDKFSMMSMFPMGKVYKTSDGKFAASSIEDLMDKVKNSKKDTDYFSDDELDNLKKLFEVDDDDDDDEDDYLDNEENIK
jgi:hypothetical protein